MQLHSSFVIVLSNGMSIQIARVSIDLVDLNIKNIVICIFWYKRPSVKKYWGKENVRLPYYFNI